MLIWLADAESTSLTPVKDIKGGDKVYVESAAKMKAEEFLNYLKEAKSKSTLRIYRRGLELFSEYYQKSLDEILEERRTDLLSRDSKQRKRFVRELEKFHKWLLEEKKYPLNSASSYCDGIIQLFRYFEMPITLPSGTDIRKRVLTTKDFVPTPEQYQKMFKVADSLRDRLIISMGLNLAWRIGDFVRQRKDQLPNLDQEPPILYELITRKEDVTAKSFLSEETVRLLKQYLPTLTDDNPYLFPSATSKGKDYTDDWTVNQILRRLAKKAEIIIPKRKRLRFHAFRKRFLSTCANQSVDVNIAKILTGKKVELDMLTYLSETEHRKAFIKVYDKLKLTEDEERKTVRPSSEMEKELEDLKRLVYGLYARGYRHVVQEVKETLLLENLTLREAKPPTKRRSGFIPPSQDKPKILSIEELKQIGKEYLKNQREEYKRIIEENNNH